MLSRLLIIWSISLLMFFGSANLGAATDENLANICDLAAKNAAQNGNVPLQVLLAITRVETGRQQNGLIRPWPWTINQGGQGHWFDTAEQAIAFAENQLAQGHENFDVGCFQINMRWHGVNFTSLKQAFDPQDNAAYAANFLLSLYQIKGDWSEAIAAYHSHTADKAKKYVEKVVKVLRSFNYNTAGNLQQPAITEIQVSQQNKYPLLKAGLFGQNGSLVPRSEATVPLIGARY